MKFYLIYTAILILRCLLNLNLQSGYIHPDEFFQTVEISAGEVLNLDIIKAWEFQAEAPIRSKAIIELFLNLPLKLLLTLQKFLHYFVNIQLNFLTVCRFWTMACSLIVDYSIYTSSLYYGANFQLALFLHGISHISIVFLSRTFSNTWETQLLSLFLVIFNKTSDKSFFQVLQGVVISIGIFCRPTFVLFVFPYILSFIISISVNRFVKYARNGAIGFLSTAACLVSVDTFQYGFRTSGVTDLTRLMRNLVVVPYNFLLYNAHQSNLAKHGIHPRYTHLVANLPLMLGPLVVVLFLVTFGHHTNRTLHLLACVAFPVCCLSLFPHQEMRFLLPVFPSAVVLVSSRLAKSRHLIVKFTLGLHVVFSFVSIVFWGYLHEGGLMTASQLISRNMRVSHASMCHKIVTYKTFMVPKFLFEIHRSKSCNHSLDNLMGVPEDKFWSRILDIAHKRRSRAAGHDVLHLVFPKAFSFKNPENLDKLGDLRSIYTIPGHINTDLWPPTVPMSDFLSLQYMSFSVKNHLHTGRS